MTHSHFARATGEGALQVGDEAAGGGEAAERGGVAVESGGEAGGGGGAERGDGGLDAAMAAAADAKKQAEEAAQKAAAAAAEAAKKAAEEEAAKAAAEEAARMEEAVRAASTPRAELGFVVKEPGVEAARAASEAAARLRAVAAAPVHSHVAVHAEAGFATAHVDKIETWPQDTREAMEAVVALTLQLFGARNGEWPDGFTPPPPCRCRYNSEGGMSEAFENWMGAMMGCVLSPDRAKLVLDSLLRAIRVPVRGFRLWGMEAATDDEHWACIRSLAACVQREAQSRLQTPKKQSGL